MANDIPTYKVVKCMPGCMQVVINAGEVNNIKLNDKFLVYELGEEIIDPETHESLGRLEILKGQGKIIHVQEKMSTLESIKFKKTVSKRIVYKRQQSWTTVIAGLSGPQEEVIQDAEDERLPFNNPQEGDFVKYIS